MGLFENWHQEARESIGVHSLLVLGSNGKGKAVRAVAKALPTQYVSNSRYARILEKLGKAEAAKYLRGKPPKTKATRSGELGEVLALSFVEERTKWSQTVKKLRWKDGRDVAMRGDDVLAVRLEGDDDFC